MEKSPFAVIVVLAVAALFLAFVAKSIGNISGGQFCLAFSTALFALYVILRIAYDFLPARFIREERQGRS